MLIAVRVKDGLFVGNAVAGQDDDFLFSNKITHVINCAGAETLNLFASQGIKYLSFPWRDSPHTIALDSQDRNITQATAFIEEAFDQGECVLIHSINGVSRACVVIVAYIINKFGWTTDNALEYVKVAHPDMDIKPYFLQQLRAYAKRKQSTIDIFDPSINVRGLPLETEQVLLRNTFINSLPFDEADVMANNDKNAQKQRRRLFFTDENGGSIEAPPTVSNPAKRAIAPKPIIKRPVISQQQQPPPAQPQIQPPPAQQLEQQTQSKRPSTPTNPNLNSNTNVNPTKALDTVRPPTQPQLSNTSSIQPATSINVPVMVAVSGNTPPASPQSATVTKLSQSVQNVLNIGANTYNITQPKAQPQQPSEPRKQQFPSQTTQQQSVRPTSASSAPKSKHAPKQVLSKRPPTPMNRRSDSSSSSVTASQGGTPQSRRNMTSPKKISRRAPSPAGRVTPQNEDSITSNIITINSNPSVGGVGAYGSGHNASSIIAAQMLKKPMTAPSAIVRTANNQSVYQQSQQQLLPPSQYQNISMYSQQHLHQQQAHVSYTTHHQGPSSYGLRPQSAPSTNALYNTDGIAAASATPMSTLKINKFMDTGSSSNNTGNSMASNLEGGGRGSNQIVYNYAFLNNSNHQQPQQPMAHSDANSQQSASKRPISAPPKTDSTSPASSRLSSSTVNVMYSSNMQSYGNLQSNNSGSGNSSRTPNAASTQSLSYSYNSVMYNNNSTANAGAQAPNMTPALPSQSTKPNSYMMIHQDRKVINMAGASGASNTGNAGYAQYAAAAYSSANGMGSNAISNSVGRSQSVANGGGGNANSTVITLKRDGSRMAFAPPATQPPQNISLLTGNPTISRPKTAPSAFNTSGAASGGAHSNSEDSDGDVSGVSSSSGLKKKKKKKRKDGDDKGKVESRLMRPTKSFLQKTIRK